MALTDYSTNPANNGVVAGQQYYPEGMLPGQVNDTGRQVMADLATWLQAPLFAGQLGMAGYRIANLGAALSAGDALNLGTADARYVLTGGATGPLSMGGYRIGNVGTALSAGDALSQGAGDARYLQLTGGTLGGLLGMGGFRIGNVGNALSGGDAMNLTTSDGRYVQLGSSPTFPALTVSGNLLAGYLKADGTAYLTVVGSDVYLNLDSGKYLRFSRTANKLYFNGGSGECVSFDASGNILAKGNLSGSQSSV